MHAIILGLAVAFPGALAAQQANSPESVFRAYLKATQEQRWTDAAELVDLSRIAEARSAVIQFARETPRVQSVEDYLRENPTMPRAVAEYFVKQHEESRIRFSHLSILHEFANTEDTTSLMRLSPLEAAARYLQAKDPRYAMGISLRMAPGCERHLLSPEELEQLTPRYEVLGTAVRGDTAWIMHRDTSRNSTVAVLGPSVAVLYRRQERWFLDVDHPRFAFGSGGNFAIQCTDRDSAVVRRP